MADRGDHLHEVLNGYAKFLQKKKLALDKHQPYLVRWVREFLLFARAHAGFIFEHTLDLFLNAYGRQCGGRPDWMLAGCWTLLIGRGWGPLADTRIDTACCNTFQELDLLLRHIRRFMRSPPSTFGEYA